MIDLYRPIAVSTKERLPYPVLACHAMRPSFWMDALCSSRWLGGLWSAFAFEFERGGTMILASGQ
jgi:hypothetical protein